MLPVTEKQATELEAAAFRRLVAHLQQRSDVQNIDLMTLAGFCRNCLGNWIEDAARDAGLPVDRAAAREHVYGMPAEVWKARFQREASEAQQNAFAHAAHQAEHQPSEAGEGSRTSPSSRQAET